MTQPPPQERARTRLSISAVLVATGILFSRISGYVRITLFSYVFGLTPPADAFNAALRIPNFLQNLLGDGVLSASLIPVYARLMSRENQARADQVARAILGVLAVTIAALVAAGVTFAPALLPLIAPGYSGETRELTITLVRIFFPGIGLLVFSAWCIAVLNSHHRFFLAYVAPVCWNAAIITALVLFRHLPLDEIAIKLSWAALVGAALQLAVQVPGVWRIMAPHWSSASPGLGPHVREVLTSSVPVIFSRGVVQVSSYVDTTIATLLPAGALTALTNATQLYQLPIALFGMSVTSATLPSLAAANAEHRSDLLRMRLEDGQRMIAVLVVPSVMAFLAIGDVMIAMLLEHGAFTHVDTIYVATVLAGSAIGLLATTVGRLYANGFYALGDTRTPMHFAVIRVVLVGVLGYLLAVVGPPLVHVEAKWGAVGLTASAGFAGWLEFVLLRRALTRRVSFSPLSVAFLARAWGIAGVAAAVATALRWVLPVDLRVVRGLVIVGAFGSTYLALSHAAGLMSLTTLVRRVFRRPGRARA
jgi:putative peptidoglycan lipid II flippase